MRSSHRIDYNRLDAGKPLSSIKEQFGVLILMCLVVVLLSVLWIFRADHDVVLTISSWIAGVIGAIINLVTGKPQPSQQSNISNSKVNQVVEKENPPSSL